VLQTILRPFNVRPLAGGTGSPLVAVVGGTAAGQAIVLATTPIISRLYTQADLGVLGLFVSFVSVAGIIVTARYEVAIPGAKTDADAVELLHLGLAITVPLALACTAFLLAMKALGRFGFETLPWWAVLATAPAGAALGWFNVLRFWGVRTKQFKQIGRVLVIQSIGKAVIPVLVGLFATGPGGLITGEVAGRLAGVRQMFVDSKDGLRWGRGFTARMRAVATTYWKTPAVFLPSGLLDILGLALPVPLIANMYGVAAAGTFLMVQRLTMLPAALVAAGAGDVLHSTFVDAYAQGAGAARAAVNRAARRLLVFALAMFVPAALAAPWVLPRFLGAQWEGSGELFRAIAPWSMASLVVGPLSRVLAVVERKELKLVYDIVALGLLLAGMVGASAAGLDLTTAIAITGAGQVISYIVYYALIRRACGHEATRA
jgi:O-antigen/teichoic acid export membrane protein